MDITAIAARAPVIPVLTIERVADAVPLARALVKGGQPVLEITFRTGAAVDALTAIAREVPEAVVGAGTVLDVTQLRQALAAGRGLGAVPRLYAGPGPGRESLEPAIPARRPDGVGGPGDAVTGLPAAEVLSRRCRRWHDLAEGDGRAAGRGAVLSH